MHNDKNLPAVVILSGGYGKRLYPQTKKIPKCLIKIDSKPFLFYQLKLLEKNNFKKVIICSGYKSDQIKKFLYKNKQNFNFQLLISDDGKKKLGTGGAIKKILKILGKNFFVIFGDSYLDVDYKKIYRKFIQLNKKDLIVTHKYLKKYNIYPIFPEMIVRNNNILQYKNFKKEMTHLYYGIGVFNNLSFKDIKKKTFDLHFFFKKMILNNNLLSYTVQKKFYEIGSKYGLNETKNFLKKNE